MAAHISGTLHARAYGYGRTQIDLTPQQEPPHDIRLKPFAPKALYLSFCGIGNRTLCESALDLIEVTDLNALVIDVKGIVAKTNTKAGHSLFVKDLDICSRRKCLLAHPLTRGLELDDPRMTEFRLQVMQSKPFLRRIYADWYQMICSKMPNGDGSVLEIGSGAGHFVELAPKAIQSEVFSVEMWTS
jgi:hypothetical protein